MVNEGCQPLKDTIKRGKKKRMEKEIEEVDERRSHVLISGDWRVGGAGHAPWGG